MSEEQEPYDLSGLEDVEPLPEPPPPAPSVTVRIEGPQGAGKTRLGELLACILTESSMVDAENGIVHVMGYVEPDVSEFLDKLKTAEGHAVQAKKNYEELAEKYLALHQELERERQITGHLEQRLADVAARKLALHVVHGDTAPEQFEQRRRMEIEAVRNLVAGARVTPS